MLQFLHLIIILITKAIYDGIEYTNLVEHSKRPFEIEARSAETKYFKQVKNLLNN